MQPLKNLTKKPNSINTSHFSNSHMVPAINPGQKRITYHVSISLSLKQSMGSPAAMILMHRALNIVFPLAVFISLLLLLPPYLVFKLLSYIKRSIFCENVAGKVVLITGASSGIGEVSIDPNTL